MKKILCINNANISTRSSKTRNKSFFFTVPPRVCKTLTDSEISQLVEVDLQKNLAWLIIEYFQLNLDLILQTKKH